MLKTQLRLYDWVHHYEKMLYDNALLVRAYLHAWQVFKNPFYKRVAEETLEFIAREMTHEQGGFYSSLDADSEGEEGKFYVWTQDEIREVLRDDYEFLEAAYGITAKGNWEGKTVLQRALDDASLAARFKLNLETVQIKLADSHSRLLTARSVRVRPGTDDKVLTAWNGLMLAAVAEAARVLQGNVTTSGAERHEAVSPSSSRLLRRAGRDMAGEHRLLDQHPPRNDKYYNLAARNAEFLLSELRAGGKLRRSWRNGVTTNEVFLEDYAAFILGLLELYQTDFNVKWFTAAMELADEMIERFQDEDDGGFFDTPHDGEELLLRPKDIQDNAAPCGNSLACEALLKLAEYTGEGRYRDLAEKSLTLIAGYLLRYPLGFARWLSAAEHAAGTVKQVAVVGEADGEDFERMIHVIRSEYRPGVVVAASSHPIKEGAPPLLNDRAKINDRATAYVCEGFVCRQPTNEIEILIEQLKN